MQTLVRGGQSVGQAGQFCLGETIVVAVLAGADDLDAAITMIDVVAERMRETARLNFAGDQDGPPVDAAIIVTSAKDCVRVSFVTALSRSPKLFYTVDR